MTLTSALKHFLDRKIPFVSYRLPSEKDPVSLVGGIFSDSRPAQKHPFFVFAPFDASKENPVQYFSFQKKFKGFNPEGLIQFQSTTKTEIFSTFKEPSAIGFEEYSKQASAIISLLKQGSINKVVLSRVIRFKTEFPLKAAETFVALCEKYPEAFVYILSDGKSQLWLGASPETLLRVEDGKGMTMSLAGTQAAGNKESIEIIWQNKEKDEQNFVTDYLSEKLQNCSVTDIQKSETETIFAGKIAHLRTKFSFNLTEESNILNLAQNLHPTPAVCGTPAKKALEIIRKTEKHDRSFYAGYLGMIENEENAQFFVNLRCMQIWKNYAFLYVGGGLTAESDIKKEWEETLLKAETLMAVIANNS
ncbi:MAG: isochorismate synthase [Bacteroidales bacterium]|nr:isochorismate synthase [Bacteroidales bacterium]